MKKLLALLVIAVMFMCVNVAGAGDLTASEVVSQVHKGVLIGGSPVGESLGNNAPDKLLVTTKTGEYYEITMKDGKYTDCKKIHKAAYTEWVNKHQTR